jgi:hypothetical protein
MKIYKSGATLPTPKNFSRKNKICSCLCTLTIGEDVLNREKIVVKYEVEPHIFSYYMIPKLKKNQWSSYQTWGEFKKVIELPKIFEKLDDEKDFYIKIAHFLRDNVQMPLIYEVVITNVSKYQMIKLKDERKNKLLTIKNR